MAVQSTESKRIWKSPLAWSVALFFGFQSLLFYASRYVVSGNFSIERLYLATAGWLLSVTNYRTSCQFYRAGFSGKIPFTNFRVARL